MSEANNSLHTYNSLGHRLHKTPLGCFPGVTTVLSNTKDQYFLDKWKVRVGEEEAKKVVDLAIDRGDKLHSFIENRLLKQNNHAIKAQYPENQPILEQMCLAASDYIKDLEPILIESATYHPLGFGGSPDLVARCSDGKITLFDWKNSLKPKRKEYITDYYLQLAAYSMSIKFTHDISVSESRVVVFAISGGKNKKVKLQEFISDKNDLQLMSKAFLRRLDSYQKKYSQGEW